MTNSPDQSREGDGDAEKEKRRAYGRGWRERNREKHGAYNRAWNKKHPEKQRAYRAKWREKHGKKWRQENPELCRAIRLKEKYGLSLDAFQVLWDSQVGRCKICGVALTQSGKGAAHVDHDHTTDRVRGLLCRDCNSVLGFAHDRTKVLQKAVEYLDFYAQFNTGTTK